MKQHPTLSRTVDYDLCLTDQEPKVSNENLIMDTIDMEDVDLSTLANSSPANESDKNNLFFCHECSTEVTSFEDFEKHMNKHFMEIENGSNVPTSPTKISLAGIISAKELFINFVALMCPISGRRLP